MKKHTIPPPTPRFQLNKKDIPPGMVYLTGDAIASWSRSMDATTTHLDNCTWHEDITSGTLLYIVTDLKHMAGA